ncbi:hypothetical protein BDS110ZK23_37290 [Bradyrhizobium diazoefficiens]|nr:hypothetical protein XF11B_53410 [Bradyrhizobium diazoefficiens]BCF09863.1 hypothetical protein XF12B_52360 [Bradyrhizobium diazoefficiens]
MQVSTGTGESVQLGHHDHVTGSDGLQEPFELAAAGYGLARLLLRKDPLTTGGLQGLDLGLMILTV